MTQTHKLHKIIHLEYKILDFNVSVGTKSKKSMKKYLNVK